MDAYEIPLVIFTVFSQWAVGITIAVALLEWAKPKYMNTVGKRSLSLSIYTALVVSVVGVLASVLHINNPLKGVTTLFGLGSSWLSREIVAVIFFNLSLFVLAYLWWKKSDQDSVRKHVGTLTALLGVVLVISSAMVYFSMELHPTWNNWTTFANFLLTSLLLGALTVAFFVLKRKQDVAKAEKTGAGQSKEPEAAETGVMKLLSIYLAVEIVLLLVTIGSTAMISTGAIESQIAASISFTSIMFWVRILCSLLIPAAVLVFMVKGKNSGAAKALFLATLFVLIGELSGRGMFYYSVMSQYPWF